jgi:NCAIR mutase (PurE)-related protein
MDKEAMRELLEEVKAGNCSPEDALLRMKMQPFEDLGYAKVDHHRGIRQGTGEVIFGQNKTPEQIEGIVRNMIANGAQNILVTRLSKEGAEALTGKIPFDYYEMPKLAIANPAEIEKTGSIVVASGGTSDMPVCEEAALTAEALGNRVTRVYDVGVAGLHRLLSNLEPFMSARVVIVAAGMEGALASVVGGLVDCPVIAVPTSVGYGASFGGLSALLLMLNSCASGVSVVNIDNGFGAGYLASMINKMGGK